MIIPATCELWIDGNRYADGQPAESSADPFALADLTVHWGRENSIDQPEAATCTFTIMDPPGGSTRFDETVALGSTVVVWSALDGKRQVIFGGRITDMDAEYDSSADAAVCRVVAADQMADLANRFVGAEPWPMEQMWQRVFRIVTAVGLDPALVVQNPIPTPPSNVNLTRMDVDRQAAAGLLYDVAVSVGAVLWSAYNPATGSPYLIYENPAKRASLYVFAENVATLKWRPTPGAGAGTPLSACEVLEDPVKWSRAVTDLITRATVRWQDQTTSPGVTERSVQLVDTVSEVSYGARGISIGTELTTATDANALANGTLAAHSAGPTWRTSGLTWDLALTETGDTVATRDLAWTLLGGVTRLGYAVSLTDLPYWTPTSAAVQLYIEGGTYTFDTDDAGTARWVLALNGSPASGLGGSLSYGATDRSVRYVDVDRSVTFLAMIGVGPAGPTGHTWEQLSGTWEQLTGRWADL